MRCTRRFLGHKWSEWETLRGKVMKMEDGRLGEPHVQRRRCEICGFNQSEWLPDWTVLDVADDNE